MAVLLARRRGERRSFSYALSDDQACVPANACARSGFRVESSSVAVEPKYKQQQIGTCPVSAFTGTIGPYCWMCGKKLQCRRYAHSRRMLACRGWKRFTDAEFPGISQSVWRAGHGAFYGATRNQSLGRVRLGPSGLRGTTRASTVAARFSRNTETADAFGRRVRGY
jgi:hypothetical protein